MKSNLTMVSLVLVLLVSPIVVYASGLIQSRFSYLSSTPDIHYQVTVDNKSIVSASLVVVDVGEVAPAGYEVASAELISQRNLPSTFTFSKPDQGWPLGVYKIVVKSNDRIIETVLFNVIPASDTAANDETRGSKDSSVQSGVLAQGTGGQLTENAANAYVDALEFIHAQMGQPRHFNAAERQTIVNNLATSYPSFPYDTQVNLAQARQLLSEYQSSWEYIGLDEQKDFAYSVLAIAYGEREAAQALGYNSGGGSSGGGSSYYSDGASYVSDGNCAIFSSEYGSVSSCD